jgi:uridylate kinase
MDATAMVMCRDNDIPMRVMNVFNEGELARVILGESIGTLVHRG